MLNRFTYPIVLTPDDEDEGFVVTFPDIQHAITQGDNVEECLEQAVDCLEEALASCIDDGEDIPVPSAVDKGDLSVAPRSQMAIKVEIYQAWKNAGISKVNLASRMGISEAEARRILDPRHGTKLPTMERALLAMGKKIELKVA